MQAAVLDEVGGSLRLQEVTEPKPARGEVLIRVAACGVCSTDLKVVDGLAGSVPLIPGHEVVGTIVEVGEEVHTTRVGDRVCVHPFFSCGNCAACGRGEEEACVLGMTALAGVSGHGGYAELMVAPANHVVPLPDALSFADAAPLLCAGLTTYAAFRNAGVQPGDRTAVVGVGGLGHLAISIGCALGAQVYAVTSSPDKVADAESRGAVFSGSVDDVTARLARDGGTDVVINTVDSLAPLARIIPVMATQGRVVLAAGSGDVLPVTPAQLMERQIRILGTFFGSTQDTRDLLELAVHHEIRPQVERYNIKSVNEVHDRLRQNRVRYRAVLDFGLV